MGNIMYQRIFFEGFKKKPKTEYKDGRRRNSLAFSIARYKKFDGESYDPLIEEIRRDKAAIRPRVKKNVRDKKYTAILENIAQGNMRETRSQVINNFRKINRNYRDPWNGATIAHVVCQEGYLEMLEFMMDPSKHSEFDHVKLDFNICNERERTPLLLVFTPPTGTHIGQCHGVDSSGNPIPQKPEGVELLTDWIRSGNEEVREEILRILIEQTRPDVNFKDYHNYTALHYTCMWGWEKTLRLLIAKQADVNCQTAYGRTALMFAVEFCHPKLVEVLLAIEEVHVNLQDVDGITALFIAVEHGHSGYGMAKMLLERGADPNIATSRKNTPLKVACEAQNIEMINLLLDHKAHRRQSALEMTMGQVAYEVNKRVAREEKEAMEEARRLEDERLKNNEENKGGFKDKSPWGAWVRYADKKGNGKFYYNPVTRESRRDRPKDFQPNKQAPGDIKKATYGMHFYH